MLKLISYCAILVALTNSVLSAKDYIGAELYSKDVVKYGRFDVRMRAVSGSGIISSFFLYYDDSYLGSPEPWQEIDIEIVGKNDDAFQSNIITGSASSKTTSEDWHEFENLSESYHTYSYEWTPDYIAWFFDGVEVRRTTGAQVTDCQPKDMSYRFNLWISDVVSWAGQFDPSILPVYQFINWIKYSSYTPGSGTDGSDFTPEWQDDFDSFNSARWGKGDWTFDGNMVDFTADNIVTKEGYCIICLTTANAPGFTGTVPKDASTSVAGRKSAVDFTIKRMSGNRMRTFSVSLDGRLLSRKQNLSKSLVPAVWLTKNNATVLRNISIAR